MPTLGINCPSFLDLTPPTAEVGLAVEHSDDGGPSGAPAERQESLVEVGVTNALAQHDFLAPLLIL